MMKSAYDSAIIMLGVMTIVFVMFNLWAAVNLDEYLTGSSAEQAISIPVSHKDNSSMSQYYRKGPSGDKFHPSKWKPRLFAGVPMNWPPKHTKQLEHHFNAILDTWGKHVEILKFLVSEKALKDDPPENYPWVPRAIREDMLLGVPMKRSDGPKARNIWEKMWRTWKLVGEEYLDKADYFAKVDLDAFYFAENMKVYGAYLNPDEPWYMGHTLLQRWDSQNLVYNSGTTYVMSRETVRQLSIRLRDIPTVCDKCGGSQCADRAGAGEDPQTGGCLRDLGILPADTLDHQGRQRFNPFRPRDHLFSVDYHDDPKDWFWRYKGAIGKKQVKRDCCSPYPISFHNFKTNPALYDENALYELEYFFHTAPYESRIIGLDPPSGKLFQYDPNAIDFEIDEHRNNKRARENELLGKW
eukprot:CAMPEP_0167753764 /NCGR_PEP_ID=MMETSP0110_2-20121227/7895_1 /TAXON_ID=629695 /ORGANISM="Gymnochlora sp., Strain CCMP2014" /LENGTH=410 /DNA_ID=CAMNT_0007639567 /DNA_START=185 /DNA_END=1414 /DNA_ORIENTATION=+